MNLRAVQAIYQFEMARTGRVAFARVDVGVGGRVDDDIGTDGIE